MERIAVDLSGVPQTLLWNLGRRAEAARSGGSLLRDPRAVEVVEVVEVVDRLDYDFADARRGAQWHAVRVATFDAAVRRFLTAQPAGTVVALGEVPRDPVLASRQRHHALADGRSSRDAGRAPQGAARRSEAAQPRRVGARARLTRRGGPHRAGAGHRAGTSHVLPARGGPSADRDDRRAAADAAMVFDVVPEAMLRMVSRRPDSEQATSPWTWMFNAGERAGIGAIRGVAGVRDLPPPLAPAVASLLLGAVRRLPRRVRYALPVFPVLEVTFRRP